MMEKTLGFYWRWILTNGMGWSIGGGWLLYLLSAGSASGLTYAMITRLPLGIALRHPD